MTSGHSASLEDTWGFTKWEYKKAKAGPMGQPLRIQSRSQRPRTSDLSGPGPLPRTGLQPHQPARLRGTKRPPRAAQALTLFSAKSFSFCSCRLRSTQAAVSSSQGSSSPSAFIFLKRGESGLPGAPLLFPAPDSRAPGRPPQGLPLPALLTPLTPAFGSGDAFLWQPPASPVALLAVSRPWG